MNIVTVCNPTAEQPFESFVENTTTFVCVPEGCDRSLYFQVRDAGELTIESDGEEIFKREIEPKDHRIDLKEILTPSQPPASLFRRSFGTRPKKIRDFKVTVARGRGPSSMVAATFDFQLLSPAEYKLAYARYLANCPTSSPSSVYPHRFVVDWDVPGQKQCWNCRENIAEHANQCTRCGSEQDKEGSAQP
jgi:hypothetical protein